MKIRKIEILLWHECLAQIESCLGLYSNKYCVVLLWVLLGRVQCERQQLPILRNFWPAPSLSSAAQKLNEGRFWWDENSS